MEAGFIPASSFSGNPAPTRDGGGGGIMAPQVPIIRAPDLKRGKMEEAISDRIKLESVLGLTVGSNAALDSDPNTELVAYPAGCTVVLYNVRKNLQLHVLNACRKSVTCVAFSPDGRYLATGECGHAPAVRVWDLQDVTTTGAVQIAEFPGHTHGVNCVSFSTSSKYLVSVGSQHDMIVNVWDWRANLKLASNKVTSRVKAISFSESGNYFVTVGFRHVKFWYLEYSRNAKIKEPVPLMGRSAILGEQKDNEFCDVACGRGSASESTFAITRSGLLAEFNGRRMLDKWVDLRTSSANCMAIDSRYIFVGCAEGIVRVFTPHNLAFVTTLPRAHYLGIDVASGVNISHMFSKPGDARYPDAVALTYDERNHKLTCIYNDHSLYVWDVRDITRVGKSHSALYHSACIWGMDMMASGTFLTCSSDDTVRAWRLGQRNPPNIYSNELTKVVYIDPELKYLKDADLTATSEKDKNKTYDDKTGVRCVRVSPDGLHVASGDRAGNVWVHSPAGALLATLMAHDAEVLCLEYSAQPRLLASASRDRLIHVFQVDKGYEILQTLDEHSSSITAVRFISSGASLQMVSCGADKTIFFRQLKTSQDGRVSFLRGQQVVARSTLYDLEVDAGARHVLAACQDRHVRVYAAASARHTKTFRGTPADDGTLIKVALDSSGIYLATSSTDKLLSVYDYYSGECMATMYGHSEIVTGLRFTPDCEHLVSASGDGCVFVWRVPHDMVVTMRARLAQQAIRHGKKVAPPNGVSGLESEPDAPDERPVTLNSGPAAPPDYTLRIGRLPSWAKKSLGDELPPAAESPGTPPVGAGPRGKWATRVQPPPHKATHEKRVDSDGSKDSSLDSGTDTRYVDRRTHSKQVTINLSKTRTIDSRTRHHTDDSSLGSFKYEDQESTEHDGDIEDISDGERTSSSERGARPTYYPGNNNDDTPSEFMVNAMDAEELRASVRRTKRRSPIPPSATSLSSPQDTDEDEVSTPSGDNAERNPLSGSCESIDTAGRREKYLKSAFDSLSGAEMDTALSGGHTSLSARHLQRPRAPLPHPLPHPHPHPAPRAAQKVVDPEAHRLREELNKRILETRKQLENVAFRSNLKSSQSTSDLSYVPEKEVSRRVRPLSMAVPAAANNRTYGAYQEETLDSLNSNFYDSLNPYQYSPNNADLKNKNPYAIPANLNHIIPEYLENIAPYVPPHANLTNTVKEKKNLNFTSYNKPVVFKEQIPQRQNLAFTVEVGKPQSKVFNRLFPTKKDDPPKVPPRNFTLNLTKVTDDKPQKVPKPSARSIFKNYKSCPVSPVSEECKWSDKIQQQKAANNSLQNKKRNSLSFFIGLDNKTLKDNGQSLVDTIKSDTQKMIAEITKKYGDLDEYDVSVHDDLDLHPTKEEKDDGNFSSDSLEDCSLSQDASCKNKLYSKRVCRKHNKTVSLPRRAISNYEISDKPTVPAKPSYITNQKSSTLPRNMPSNLDDIEDEDYNMNTNYMYRCQSVLTKRCITNSNESVLSDNSNCSSVSNEIFLKYGNEVAFQQAKFDKKYNLDSQNCSYENIHETDYLENHRHSSASFFLNQKKYMKSSCSQESVLSDDMYLEDNQLSRSNCNSLESVLSDDTECTKSAPLEMLFEGTKKHMQKHQNVNIPKSSKSCYEFDNVSKSYGSSPNSVPSFANYMQYNYLSSPQKDFPAVVAPKPRVNKVYGFEVPISECGHKTVTRSKSLHDSTQPPPAKPIAYYFDGNNVQAYTKTCKKDEIPRLNTGEFMAKTTKSLQPQFASKHKYKSEMEGCEDTMIKTNSMIKSKSCSFEVVLEPASKPNPIKNLIEKRSSHVQKNLEKFEEQIRINRQSKVNKNQTNKEKANSIKNTKSLERGSTQKNNGKVTMEFVPHKPPKPAKRTSSVKINNKLKAGLDKSGLSSSISSHYKAKLDGLQNKNYLIKKQTDNNSNVDDNEKTFDVFVKEKDVNENKSEIQMDSLEVYSMQRMERMKEVSMDSLDVIEDTNDFAKDSLDYYAEHSNKRHLKKTKDQINMHTKSDVSPCHSKQSDSKENIAPKEEIQKFKYLERKIEIINKLVEMEERKILQEKVFKEWRMRPLKANINDGKGVVKVLSRKFEKLAKKQSTVPNFASLTLEEADTDTETSESKEIKRNLSLPDILDSDQIGEINSNINNENIETENKSGNENTEPETTPDTENSKPLNANQNNTTRAQVTMVPERLNNTIKSDTIHPRYLKQRVYNEMVIPKTDVHLDSENYESSTTSSSCTNSPKRMTFYGFNRPKTPFRKVVRVPTPRLCMERCPRPVLGLSRGSLSRRMPLQAAVLPSKFVTANRNHLSPSDAEDDGTGMRRAISLSDLAAKPLPAPRKPQCPLKQQSSQNVPVRSPSGFLRPAPRHTSKAMTRSSSVGMLNQSDSESDGQPRQNAARISSGLMRPTISSMNKQAANAARRRGLPNAYSAMSLSAGQEGSSSEAEESREKPLVQPRPRAGSVDHTRRIGRSGSDRDISGRGGGGSNPVTRPRTKQDGCADTKEQNLSSSELCAVLTAQLTRTAGRVAQLYRTLQQEPGTQGDVSDLEAAILETQKVLHSVVRQNGESSSGQHEGVDSSQRIDLLAKEGASNPAMSLIEQYSDILLNMMQSKMVTHLNTSPHSLPPAPREPGADS